MGCVYTGISRQAIYVYIGLTGSINIVNCYQIFDYQMVTLREKLFFAIGVKVYPLHW